MRYLDPERNQLSDILVKLLSSQFHLSTKQLLSLASKKRQFSTAAVYKELTHLRDNGTVVKSDKGYSLSLTWVLNMIAYAESLHTTYLRGSYLSTILPEVGRQQSWKFKSMLRANDFWNQLLLALVEASRAKVIFAWVPHPWFVLTQTSKEAHLHRALSLFGKRSYTIFGGTAYLDRLADRFYRGSIHEVSYATSPFHQQGHRYIDLIDDHILTVTPDSATTRRIHRLFMSVKKSTDFEPGAALSALTAPCSVRITLEHDPKKAARLHKTFANFFGLRGERLK